MTRTALVKGTLVLTREFAYELDEDDVQTFYPDGTTIEEAVVMDRANLMSGELIPEELTLLVEDTISDVDMWIDNITETPED